MGEHQGRLELTWTNKHLRLLAHDDGRYEWVPPSDYRVAEVRLLDDVTAVGEVSHERARDNLLIRGDALNALRSLARLPEFASEYLGKVKLAYLDPPFNTQQSFLQYDDALEHSVWLTMMRDRLLIVKELLAPDGSVWVHCDDSEQAYLKVVMDEIFIRDNFVATVVWEKVYSPRMDAKRFSSSHDYLLVYAKSAGWEPNRLTQTEGPAQANRTDEAGRAYRLRSLRKEGKGSRRTDRPNLWYPTTAPDGTVVFPVKPDGTEGRWRWGESTYRERQGDVDWQRDRRGSWQAYLRQHADEAKPFPPETIWPHHDVGHNHEAVEEIKRLFPQIEPFDTPKPERLMRRIIQIATKDDDIVLDPFAGSATTAAVAHKMGRGWVVVEREPETIQNFALPRLTRVVNGADPGGITEAVGWAAGGGFRVLDVAPSMFDADAGMVFLADWMTNGKLAEATAAQLGFEYEVSPPFVGRKGRTRLAVVDGVVNEAVVRILASALADRERVVVCGTGIDTEARPILRELRPGSTLRKIPAALLDEYRSSRQLRLDLGAETEATEGEPEAATSSEVTA